MTTVRNAGDPSGVLFKARADEVVPYQFGVNTAQALHDVTMGLVHAA
jgi:hypothetical protein